MADINTLLQNTQAPNDAIRQQAEAQLKQLEEQDPAMKMMYLAKALSDETMSQASVGVRQIAGLLLKNMLDAKNDATKQVLFQRWLAMDQSRVNEIKTMAMQTLASPQLNAARAAAQVIANIGLIELPMQRWTDLIKTLQDNVQVPNMNLKISSLEAIGYICDEIDPDVLGGQSNTILTAVIQGMRSDEQWLKVRIAATKALDNAMIFISSNFHVAAERNFIMQTVCEACAITPGEDTDAMHLKQAAFETLVNVAAHYHEFLAEYMNSLSQITFAAIQNEDEAIARMAIEFWCTICDEEMELYEEHAYGNTQRANPEFIKQAQGTLVPLLLKKLVEVDADDDDDDNISTSAGTCLTLIAQTVKDESIGHVLSFVETNIQQKDWRLESGAILGFGFILDGPSADKLAVYIQAMVPMLMNVLQRPEPAAPAAFTSEEHMEQFEQAKRATYKVKYAAAWTLGRLAEFHGHLLEPQLHGLMELLVACLRLEPGLANNACWALHFLAAEFGEDADGPARPSNPLTPFFQGIIQQLFETTMRPDATEENLRISAYEVINGIIAAGADDTIALTTQLIEQLLHRIRHTFSMGNDPQAQSELQGLLCGVFTAITTRLGAAIKPYADFMMEAFLNVINSQSATVHEEALMAISSIAVAIGTDFNKYVVKVVPVLQAGLKNYEEYEVCNVAVGLVGDICRALEKGFMQYADPIVKCLLENLQNPALDNVVKPPILAVFGDLAMAVGGEFERYLASVMTMLYTASVFQVSDPTDEMDIEYLNEIRESVLDAYVGVLHGLAGDSKTALLNPYLEQIFLFLQTVNADPSREASVTRVAVALIGDLAALHGDTCAQALKQESIIRLVQTGLQEEVEEAQYAKQKMLKYGAIV